MNMYFLAVVLPPLLNEKVLQLKRMMNEQYGCKVALKSPAHITLIPPFWLHPSHEQDLLKDVDIVAQTVTPFIISTNHFSAFKPRTIFIAVQPKSYLNDLKKRTDDFFAAKENYKIKLDRRPFHPHITIATRDLSKKAFYDAWPLFENKQFAEEWIADNICVLKHNTKNWDILHTAPFNNISSKAK